MENSLQLKGLCLQDASEKSFFSLRSSPQPHLPYLAPINAQRSLCLLSQVGQDGAGALKGTSLGLKTTLVPSNGRVSSLRNPLWIWFRVIPGGRVTHSSQEAGWGTAIVGVSQVYPGTVQYLESPILESERGNFWRIVEKKGIPYVHSEEILLFYWQILSSLIWKCSQDKIYIKNLVLHTQKKCVLRDNIECTLSLFFSHSKVFGWALPFQIERQSEWVLLNSVR